MSVSVCVYVYICVCVCGLYLCVCLSVYVSVSFCTCIVVSVCPCICVCVGATSPPTPTLLGELCPEQGACYGSQRRGREGRGRGEGKGGPALCLSRRESPLSGDPVPPVPCSVPSNHHADRAPGPLVPAGPTGTRESYSLERFHGLQGFCYSKCGRRVSLVFLRNRISGPSPAQAPADSESRIVIHLNTKCEKHCPGLPLPCAGGRMVWGLI